jgi:ABC-type multidrug transport system fused ATPase/permease subunit
MNQQATCAYQLPTNANPNFQPNQPFLFVCCRIEFSISLLQVDGTIIRLDDVCFSYPAAKADAESTSTDTGTGAEAATSVRKSVLSPLRLKDMTVSMDQSTRMAILGRNGCGKSTLIKLITGQLDPTEGLVSLKRQARVAYIAQHHSEALDMNSNPLETMLKAFPGWYIGFIIVSC